MSSFAMWSVPIATGLTYAPHFVKVGVLTRANVYRNTHPREVNSTQKEATDELVARLGGCHANQLETLGLYAAGIAAATVAGVPKDALSFWAGVYVAARTMYVVAYAAPQVAGGFPRFISFSTSMGSMMRIRSYAAMYI